MAAARSNIAVSDRRALNRDAAHYREGTARVARIFERLCDAVRNEPYPSLLSVMGVHGPFLSRTVSLQDDPAFVVQDRYGIPAAVLVNNTECDAGRTQHYTAAFATPARILAGVMRCLARDPARLDAVMKFDEAYDFRTFLYE